MKTLSYFDGCVDLIIIPNKAPYMQ